MSKIQNYLKNKNLLKSFEYWEEKHHSLVYALKLEKVMMVFLFSSMVLLVAFSISNGLVIVLNKAKFDFSGLWILGASKSTLLKSWK